MGVEAIAAVSAIARRRVISHFLSQNAVSADKAVPFSSGRLIERRFFDRLVRTHVAVEAAPGTWYLDPPALDAFHQGQRKVAALGVTAVVLAAAAGLAIAVIA